MGPAPVGPSRKAKHMSELTYTQRLEKDLELARALSCPDCGNLMHLCTTLIQRTRFHVWDGIQNDFARIENPKNPAEAWYLECPDCRMSFHQSLPDEVKERLTKLVEFDCSVNRIYR